MMHNIISRREFVAPCTDREALRLKLLRVLTEPPAKVDIIDQHVACLGSVVSYSSFYLEGSISHYPDQIIVHLFLVTVDARVVRLATRQELDPASTAPSIARRASAHFWGMFTSRFTLEGAHAQRPLGSGHDIQ
jgi:hypothetical protein